MQNFIHVWELLLFLLEIFDFYFLTNLLVCFLSLYTFLIKLVLGWTKANLFNKRKKKSKDEEEIIFDDSDNKLTTLLFVVTLCILSLLKFF